LASRAPTSVAIGADRVEESAHGASAFEPGGIVTTSGRLRVLVPVVVLGFGGCATTSVTQGVEGVGLLGDRLLVKRWRTTLTSSPWTGASIQVAPPEYFLCKVAEGNHIQCEQASVDLPPAK
jgi:anti-sigma factor RsiW